MSFNIYIFNFTQIYLLCNLLISFFSLSVLFSGLVHLAAGQVHPETTTEGRRSRRRSQRFVCRRAQPCGPQGPEESACSWRVSGINLMWSNRKSLAFVELKYNRVDVCRLDLDAWINEPPSESESEDEQPKAIFTKEEPKHSRPRHTEVDEKELARVM